MRPRPSRSRGPNSALGTSHAGVRDSCPREDASRLTTDRSPTRRELERAGLGPIRAERSERHRATGGLDRRLSRGCRRWTRACAAEAEAARTAEEIRWSIDVAALGAHGRWLRRSLQPQLPHHSPQRWQRAHRSARPRPRAAAVSAPPEPAPLARCAGRSLRELPPRSAQTSAARRARNSGSRRPLPDLHPLRGRLRRERLGCGFTRKLGTTPEAELVMVLIVLRTLRTGDHTRLPQAPLGQSRVSTHRQGGQANCERCRELSFPWLGRAPAPLGPWPVYPGKPASG